MESYSPARKTGRGPGEALRGGDKGKAGAYAFEENSAKNSAWRIAEGGPRIAS